MKHSRRSRSRLFGAAGAAALLTFGLLALLVGLVGGCGGNTAASRTGPTAIQTLTAVTRGDLVETVMGRVTLPSSGDRTQVVAQVAQQAASQVASGQAVTLAFFRSQATGQNGGQGGSGFGPSAQPFGQGGAGSAQNGSGFGQGGFGQGGFGFGQSGANGQVPGGKTAKGVVKSVATNDDGSATVHIAVAKLPSGVTAKYMGVAIIQVQVLAKNVLLVPTAAIKGSGSDATVQVVVNGKTSTRKVVVGKQTRAQSEIVSGLSAGDNVVWQRAFRRGLGRSPAPGQSGAPFGGVGSDGTQGGGQ